MRTASGRLDPSIQNGLLRVLGETAAPDHGANPSSIVITTAPSVWLPFASTHQVTLVDIRDMVGSSDWRSVSDEQASVLAALEAVGWPNNLVMFDLARNLRESPETGDAKNAAKRYAELSSRADVALMSDSGHVIAIIEIVEPHRLNLPGAMYQARGALRAFGVQYAYLTDGLHVWEQDVKTGQLDQLPAFPSPSRLGLQTTAPSGARPKVNRSSVIVRCEMPCDMIKTVQDRSDTPVIIDFTLPWLERHARIVDGVSGLLPDEMYASQPLDSTTTILSLLIAHAKDRRIVAVVPRSVTANAQFAPFRRYAMSTTSVKGVLELPAGVFMPVTSIPTSVIVLAGSTDSSAIPFLALTNRADVADAGLESWLREWRSGLRSKSMGVGFLAPVGQERPWTVSAHHPDVRQAEQTVQRLAVTARLADLCTIRRGQRFARDEAQPNQEGHRVVRGRDLGKAELARDDLARFTLEEPLVEDLRLRTGDILIQRVGESPHVRLVGDELVGAVAGDTVFLVRMNDDRASPELIVQFLQSLVGQNLLRAGMSGIVAPTLPLKTLEAIPIPLLSATIAAEIAAAQRVEHELRTSADRMESMRLSIFSAQTPRDLTQQLDTLRRTARSMSLSMQQAAAIDFQIRNFYPYPLAYPYRTLASFTSLQDRYKEQLRVAENMLAYLASLTLALITPEDRQAQDLGLVEKWNGGISPGHWRELLQRGGKVVREYKANSLAVALAGLWRKPFTDWLEAMVKAKNDFKHDRGPKVEEDYGREVPKLATLLDNSMASLAFLMDYPVRLVTTLDGVRGSRAVVIQALRYEGDHPGLMQERLQYPEPLATKDLYVQVQADLWVSLFPFITVRNCPECKWRETYFIDYWQRDKPAKLKSFERGHVEQDVDIASELERWLL